jgi:hypothetical protein
MGFFGTYLYQDGIWRGDVLPGYNDVWQPIRGDEPPAAAAEPWLLIDIHDSDITTVRYAPAGPGSGVAYLGYTPRSYFEKQEASAPTDVAREALGIARWWQQLHGATHFDTAQKATELTAYLAEDLDPLEVDEMVEDEDDEDLDDAEIFVEVKTAHFLGALGLPLPEQLT